ncbi:unnamed protein product [Dovyalis caffra]|uniref:Uncharacterized protein n=1 Tax=Dovyalis caffra TaxID=77055 RepID=A0AAV1RUR4_9ROSI|nr:unnamed protein product [Dovyalis caffra]
MEAINFDRVAVSVGSFSRSSSSISITYFCRFPGQKLKDVVSLSKAKMQKESAVAGDRTRVTRVTGGNTHHYTTTTSLLTRKHYYEQRSYREERSSDENWKLESLWNNKHEGVGEISKQRVLRSVLPAFELDSMELKLEKCHWS